MPHTTYVLELPTYLTPSQKHRDQNAWWQVFREYLRAQTTSIVQRGNGKQCKTAITQYFSGEFLQRHLVKQCTHLLLCEIDISALSRVSMNFKSLPSKNEMMIPEILTDKRLTCHWRCFCVIELKFEDAKLVSYTKYMRIYDISKKYWHLEVGACVPCMPQRAACWWQWRCGRCAAGWGAQTPHCHAVTLLWPSMICNAHQLQGMYRVPIPVRLTHQWSQIRAAGFNRGRKRLRIRILSELHMQTQNVSFKLPLIVGIPTRLTSCCTVHLYRST